MDFLWYSKSFFLQELHVDIWDQASYIFHKSTNKNHSFPVFGSANRGSKNPGLLRCTPWLGRCCGRHTRGPALHVSWVVDDVETGVDQRVNARVLFKALWRLSMNELGAWKSTLPETNIAFENWWLEDWLPLLLWYDLDPSCQVWTVSFREGKYVFFLGLLTLSTANMHHFGEHFAAVEIASIDSVGL